MTAQHRWVPGSQGLPALRALPVDCPAPSVGGSAPCSQAHLAAMQAAQLSMPPGRGAQGERVREVSALLEESRGALRIEDVLPLFPDFVEIDAFKDAVCR